jgi:elongation factor Ts
MNYTLTDIKKLREETGAAILDCKNALVQAQTWDEAVSLLAAKSEGKVERVKEAGRATGEGGIFSYIHHDRRIGVLLELRCSTDFVARSESFQQLARELTLQIAGAAPVYISYEDVPTGVIRETRKRLMEQNPVLAQAPVKKRGEMIGKRLKAALPFSSILYGPARTLVHFDAGYLGFLLVQQIITLAGGTLILLAIYSIAIRRVNINGG